MPYRMLRHCELERRDRAAGPHDASQLDQRRRRVGDVPEEVGERERVERVVGKWKLLAPADEQSDVCRARVAADVLDAFAEHFLGQVDPDHLGPGPPASRAAFLAALGSISSVRAIPAPWGPVRRASWRATPAGPVATSRIRAG